MSSGLRASVQLQMCLRGFAPSTHESYLHALEDLARSHWWTFDTLDCSLVPATIKEMLYTARQGVLRVHGAFLVSGERCNGEVQPK